MARPDPYDTRASQATAPASRPGVQGPAPAPVTNVPAVAPQVQPPRSAQLAPGPAARADELNAWFDKQGYGPHSTEAQVDQARGQRNAAAAYGQLAMPGVQGPSPVTAARPGMAVTQQTPEADWLTKARAAQAGSPEWRQQFWNFNAQTGQHTFNHAAERAAREGLNLERTGTNQRDLAREAIVEQLKYHQEMARYARNMGGGTLNGSDAAAWGNAVLHYADALARYDAQKAATAQGDAVGQLNQLSRMDPAARALYLASRGVDARTIASLPQSQTPGGLPRFNATNYDTAGAQDPQTSGAAAILDNEDMPIHEKAAAFAAIPGIENPNSQHRQLWDAYMARQQARPEFRHELGMYNPLDPNGSKVYDTSTPGASLGSIFGAARDGLFGVDPAIPARNRKFHADMARLGFGPAQVTGDANDVRARIGVRPADY